MRNSFESETLKCSMEEFPGKKKILVAELMAENVSSFRLLKDISCYVK